MNILEQAKERANKLTELNSFIFISRDEIELEKHEEFLKKHEHRNVNFGAIGGHIQYILTRTSIGMFVSVECSHCKATENISDYSTF